MFVDKSWIYKNIITDNTTSPYDSISKSQVEHVLDPVSENIRLRKADGSILEVSTDKLEKLLILLDVIENLNDDR